MAVHRIGLEDIGMLSSPRYTGSSTNNGELSLEFDKMPGIQRPPFSRRVQRYGSPVLPPPVSSRRSERYSTSPGRVSDDSVVQSPKRSGRSRQASSSARGGGKDRAGMGDTSSDLASVGVSDSMFPALTTFRKSSNNTKSEPASSKEKRKVQIVWPPDIFNISTTKEKELSFMVPFVPEVHPSPPVAQEQSGQGSFMSATNPPPTSPASGSSSSARASNSISVSMHQPQRNSANTSNQGPGSPDGEKKEMSDDNRGPPRHRYNPEISLDDVRSCLKRKPKRGTGMELPSMSLGGGGASVCELDQEVNSPWGSWLLQNSMKDLSEYV